VNRSSRELPRALRRARRLDMAGLGRLLDMDGLARTFDIARLGPLLDLAAPGRAVRLREHES
jgi:hypothetical protein